MGTILIVIGGGSKRDMGCDIFAKVWNSALVWQKFRSSWTFCMMTNVYDEGKEEYLQNIEHKDFKMSEIIQFDGRYSVK